MFQSTKRIAKGLLVFGLMALSITTLHQVAWLCGTGEDSCLVAAVTFGLPDYDTTLPQPQMNNALTTPETVAQTESFLAPIISFTQVFSVYLILIAVVFIAIIELLELKYLRRITKALKV